MQSPPSPPAEMAEVPTDCLENLNWHRVVAVLCRDDNPSFNNAIRLETDDLRLLIKLLETRYTATTVAPVEASKGLRKLDQIARAMLAHAERRRGH